MKLINYKYLDKNSQQHEKGIILKNGDTIHVVADNTSHSEIVIQCKEDVLFVCSKEEYNDTRKEQLLLKKSGFFALLSTTSFTSKSIQR